MVFCDGSPGKLIKRTSSKNVFSSSNEDRNTDYEKRQKQQLLIEDVRNRTPRKPGRLTAMEKAVCLNWEV